VNSERMSEQEHPKAWLDKTVGLFALWPHLPWSAISDAGAGVIPAIMSFSSYKPNMPKSSGLKPAVSTLDMARYSLLRSSTRFIIRHTSCAG